jgi:hypothetical protein
MSALALLACVAVAALSAGEPAAAPEDPRSLALLRNECTTALGRRETTLFANGTVRVRETGGAEASLLLGELAPDETDAFRRRLGDLDLSETDRRESAVGGALVERCRLELRRDGHGPETFDYGRFGSHSLALAAALRIVEELAARATPETTRTSLPKGYRPHAGDILVRVDGRRYSVVALTTDDKGVELLGLEQPLVLYVPLAELAREFVAVEERRGLR